MAQSSHRFSTASQAIIAKEKSIIRLANALAYQQSREETAAQQKEPSSPTSASILSTLTWVDQDGSLAQNEPDSMLGMWPNPVSQHRLRKDQAT